MGPIDNPRKMEIMSNSGWHVVCNGKLENFFNEIEKAIEAYHIGAIGLLAYLHKMENKTDDNFLDFKTYFTAKFFAENVFLDNFEKYFTVKEENIAFEEYDSDQGSYNSQNIYYLKPQSIIYSVSYNREEIEKKIDEYLTPIILFSDAILKEKTISIRDIYDNRLPQLRNEDPEEEHIQILASVLENSKLGKGNYLEALKKAAEYTVDKNSGVLNENRIRNTLKLKMSSFRETYEKYGIKYDTKNHAYICVQEKKILVNLEQIIKKYFNQGL